MVVVNTNIASNQVLSNSHYDNNSILKYYTTTTISLKHYIRILNIQRYISIKTLKEKSHDK